MMYETYANPVKRGRKKTTRKRKTRRPSQATKRRTYRTRRNPVAKVNYVEVSKNIVAGAVGAAGVAVVAHKLADKVLKKPNTPVQGMVGLAMGAGLIIAGKIYKQPLLSAAGQGATSQSGLYLANKLSKDKTGNNGALDNVLAGEPERWEQPEYQYPEIIEEPPAGLNSGVLAGEPVGLDKGIFAG